MTHAHYDHRTLTVQFPGWEAIMTGRSSFTVQTDEILRAEILDGWTSEVLGYRRGLGMNGYRKLGVFIHPSGTRRLVAMKRGLPLLRLALQRFRHTDDSFDELLLSTPDASAILAALGIQADAA